ncbi:hypothetical protein VP1G_04089 [Cytospora mali]|uniref:Serine aminopeptidase S33 domain-containing protein n=1 Tax=Cytospora mali TaxID=578113 RepID=A0A194UYH1_CYTMA|nr:hypothetical protein VP1G_04089 [Valsa mali var. pyri (nom. inval.)]
MVKEIEGQFEIGDTSLYTKTWLPDDSTPCVAKLVFVHGFSDHVNRYYDFFPGLARAGIAVYGFDQRGWGRSVHNPAQKGLTGPTAQVLSDIADFIDSVIPAAPGPDVPLFVLGHSMGGGEVLTLASRPEYEDRIVSKVRGWLLEAPYIDLTESERPSMLKVIAGRLAGKLLPRMHLVNVIAPENLTRDPEVQRSLREDELCHDTGTLEGLASMLDRTADLVGGKVRLSERVQSLWLGHGDMDLATSYEASKGWFDRQSQIGDRTFKTYEGGYHQLHADLCREEFCSDVREWILKRCDGTGKETAEGEVGKIESKL